MPEGNTETKLICFYLPQFHPIKENDEWWGKGFTEWHKVTAAKPLFFDHLQPKRPTELGYYDLRLPEVMQRQTELAKEYGVYGFCFYHYWFGPGKRLLEKPVENFIESKETDMPFCLCWANENWTRRWDGSEQEVLMQQTYSDAVAEDFIESLMPAFKDRRYIRVDDKPMLIVYDTRQLENPSKSIALWNEIMIERGFEGLHVVRANTFQKYDEETNPQEEGYDAALEFPPHGISTQPLQVIPLQEDDEFQATVLDYQEILFKSVHRNTPDYELYRGIFPSWDNTARREDKAFVCHGSSPELYEHWLRELIDWTKENQSSPERRFIFINAWNEWAEGAYLEPDEHHGRAYLEATKAAHGKQRQFMDLCLNRGEYSIDKDGILNLNGTKLAATKSIKGEVEKMFASSGKLFVEGWALDSKNPLESIQLLLVDEDRILGTGRTSRTREDLAGKLGVNSMACGFEFYSNNRSGAVRLLAISNDLKYAELSSSQVPV